MKNISAVPVGDPRNVIRIPKTADLVTYTFKSGYIYYIQYDHEVALINNEKQSINIPENCTL